MRSASFAVVATLGAALAVTPAAAQDNPLGLGFAGLLDHGNRTDLAPLTVASGQPLATTDYELYSGGYYEIVIVADGSQEMAIEGSDFFRNIWIDEVVINDLEVRPLGLDSIEFDDEGEVEISFVAVRPGRYEIRVRGARGDSQKARFTIR